MDKQNGSDDGSGRGRECHWQLPIIRTFERGMISERTDGIFIEYDSFERQMSTENNGEE